MRPSNERFNEQLLKQIDVTLPSGHMGIWAGIGRMAEQQKERAKVVQRDTTGKRRDLHHHKKKIQFTKKK